MLAKVLKIARNTIFVFGARMKPDLVNQPGSRCAWQEENRQNNRYNMELSRATKTCVYSLWMWTLSTKCPVLFG